MMLSILFQIFFSLQQLELEPVILEAQAASEETDFDLVSGYDEVTQLSYSHALPKVDNSVFGPQRKPSNSLGVLTTANSALVLDKRTQSILFDKASTDQRSIASITKLMTALVLQDLSLDMQRVITIDQSDYIAGGKVHFYTGEEFILQDLWLAGLIASDNVAIRSMVRNSGLTFEEFIEAMNTKATELGMTQSKFVEPTGINANNVSSAHDVALLLQEALSNTEISDAVRRPSYTFSPLNKELYRTASNTNILVNSYLNEQPYEIHGGKTGFTYEAGYCLAVIVEGPENKDDLVVVVLGADTITDRFQEVKGLIDWTYENYIW